MPRGDSDDPTKSITEVLREAQAQGEYPGGRLNEHDEGAIAIAIGHKNGRVVLTFDNPVRWCAFTPEQALSIAQGLIDHAREAGLKGPVTIRIG
jgi:hypothetical protein